MLVPLAFKIEPKSKLDLAKKKTKKKSTFIIKIRESVVKLNTRNNWPKTGIDQEEEEGRSREENLLGQNHHRNAFFCWKSLSWTWHSLQGSGKPLPLSWGSLLHSFIHPNLYWSPFCCIPDLAKSRKWKERTGGVFCVRCLFQQRYDSVLTLYKYCSSLLYLETT